jgi:hypothetical protein
MPIRAWWTAPQFIVGILCCAYLNAFNGVFQFDDYNVIVNNTVVHSCTGWFNDLGHGIRPILKFTYLLNWLSGWGVFGFHLINIGLHATNSILVYNLTCKFTEYHLSVKFSNQLNIPALLTALLFALHPVQTEAVTYISGRSNSLMTFFYLSSLLTYINGARNKSHFTLYVLSPCLFLFAVATKEVAVTLPAALLLWEIFCSSDNWKKAIGKQTIHWLLLLILTAILIIQPNYRSLLLFGFEERGLYQNLLSQINGLIYLISRLFWIHRLNIDPDLPVIYKWSFLAVIQLCLLIGLLIFGLQNLTRKPWIGFGILWFFLHLLPTNSIIPRLDIVNERQLYLASIGIFLSVSIDIYCLSFSLTVYRTYIYAGIVFILIILGSYTVIRNADYRSQIALWEDTAKKSPQKARVFNNLGVAYELAGYSDKAFVAYSRALQLDSTYSTANDNFQNLKSKESTR